MRPCKCFLFLPLFFPPHRIRHHTGFSRDPLQSRATAKTSRVPTARRVAGPGSLVNADRLYIIQIQALQSDSNFQAAGLNVCIYCICVSMNSHSLIIEIRSTSPRFRAQPCRKTLHGNVEILVVAKLCRVSRKSWEDGDAGRVIPCAKLQPGELHQPLPVAELHFRSSNTAEYASPQVGSEYTTALLEPRVVAKYTSEFSFQREVLFTTTLVSTTLRDQSSTGCKL